MTAVGTRSRTTRRTKVGDLLHAALLAILVIAAAGVWLLPNLLPAVWAGFLTGFIVGPLALTWLREFLLHRGKQLGFKVVYAPGRTPKARQRARAGDDDEDPRPKPRNTNGSKR